MTTTHALNSFLTNSNWELIVAKKRLGRARQSHGAIISHSHSTSVVDDEFDDASDDDASKNENVDLIWW